jgi:uncharacterized membrane protein YfcA
MMVTVLATVHLGPIEILVTVLAGFAAGMVNTIVGSGSLITFPTLLALGYPAVVANVSNTIGLVFGAVSGVIGYRRELRGQQDRLRALGGAALLGGIAGSVLLLTLPGSVFRDVVPGLILFAVLLVIIQPRLSARLAGRERRSAHGGPVLFAGVCATGVYGGYFGAGQGVILLALLGIFLADDLQRLNGIKNVLALIVNGAAALIFVVAAPVAWEVAGLIAAGSIVGGQAGAHVGRRLPAPLLRGLIIVIGLVATTRLLLS